MTRSKKAFAIIGLLAFAAVLIAVIVATSQPAKQTDALDTSTPPIDSVTPDEITNVPSVTPAPEVTPSAIPTPTPTANAEAEGSDIPLTVIEDKPTPPALPDTAYPGEPTGDATIEDVEAHEALDPALTQIPM